MAGSRSDKDLKGKDMELTLERQWQATRRGDDSEELKSFSRTIAEIEWLLVILVLLFQILQGHDDDDTASVYMGLVGYCVSVVVFRYFGVFRTESRWKLAVETWIMIFFITWVLLYSGGVESPLLNLYLLTIVISALTLSTLATLLEVGLIGACYVFLWYATALETAAWNANPGSIMAQIAPMLLVAYITTMLSSDMRNAMLRIREIAELDELTGIYNVRAFTALANLSHKQSVRYRQPYSIVMIDSDNLKAINDRFGHDTGNRLLKLTVTCIQQGLRETDVLARYGGDEFVLLLPQTKVDGAFEVAERIRKTIASTPLSTHGMQVPTTVSIGIAAYPDHGTELPLVMNNADQALYGSKRGGRNRTSVSGDPET